MDFDIDLITAQALGNYYNDLKNTGFSEITDKYNMLLLVAIRTMLNDMSDYITESDMRYLAKALQCVLGSCLIGYPSVYTGDSLYHAISGRIKARLTEESDNRITEDSDNIRRAQ